MQPKSLQQIYEETKLRRFFCKKVKLANIEGEIPLGSIVEIIFIDRVSMEFKGNIKSDENFFAYHKNDWNPLFSNNNCWELVGTEKILYG